MKKILVLLAMILFSAPVLGDDDLQPEPQDQAAKEYKGFWQAADVDPMNHVVWKLYVYNQLLPRDGINRTPEWVRTGLTPRPGDNYNVIVGINQLYNFFRPAPQRGDVIIVEGHIMNRSHSNISTTYHEFVMTNLYLYPENAVLVPNEHFDPAAPPAGATASPAPSAQGPSSGAGNLTPEPTDQAVGEYKGFFSTPNMDPSNHEVWKLYIRKTLVAKDDPDHKAKDFAADLVIKPKVACAVRLNIQQLGQLLPSAKVGDVIAVEGRITNRIVNTIEGNEKTRRVRTLVMDIQSAQKLPDEITPFSADTQEIVDNSEPAPDPKTAAAAPGSDNP